MDKSNPLKWHGGKSYMAREIIKRFPKHTHYVEPYFGGGAVLFAKPPEWIECHSEVVNDIDGELINFWFVMSDEDLFPEFSRRANLTPFSKENWTSSVKFEKKTQIDRALAFFVRYRQSRQGLGKDFATLSRNRTRRGMNEQVSAWLSAVEGLPEAHERLKRVVILNDEATNVILQQDGPETFFYLDPPYLPGTRVAKDAYAHEMSEADHIQLLNVLSAIKGKFLLSGYHNEIYDAMAKKLKWKYHEIPIDNKASSKKEKEIKIEVLWKNY